MDTMITTEQLIATIREANGETRRQTAARIAQDTP
jgi:hypothetical protein